MKRREFLKKAAKGASAVGIGAVAVASLAGCGGGKSANLVRGKSPKEEILYQKTQKWAEYYAVAK